MAVCPDSVGHGDWHGVFDRGGDNRGLTGKQYVMNQIQGSGANLIYAYYEGGSNASVSTSVRDDLTVEDMRAVQQEVPGIQAASPMTEIHDRISIGGGKERDILVLGVSPQYSTVRNLEILPDASLTMKTPWLARMWLW